MRCDPSVRAACACPGLGATQRLGVLRFSRVRSVPVGVRCEISGCGLGPSCPSEQRAREIESVKLGPNTQTDNATTFTPSEGGVWDGWAIAARTEGSGVQPGRSTRHTKLDILFLCGPSSTGVCTGPGTLERWNGKVHPLRISPPTSGVACEAARGNTPHCQVPLDRGQNEVACAYESWVSLYAYSSC